MGKTTGALDERTRRALDAQDWGRLTAVLFRMARSKGRSARDAQDDAQKAIVRAYTTSPWDPDQPIVPHLLGILRSVISNDRQSARQRHELDGGEDFESAARDDRPHAEAEMIQRILRMRADKRMADLLATVEDDTLAREVVLASMEDIDKPKAQADRIGASIEDIRNARKRVWHHIDRILAETPDDSGPQSSPDVARAV